MLDMILKLNPIIFVDLSVKTVEATYRIESEKQPFLQLEWTLENEVPGVTCDVCLQSPDGFVYACEEDLTDEKVKFSFIRTGIPIKVIISCSTDNSNTKESFRNLIIPSN